MLWNKNGHKHKQHKSRTAQEVSVKVTFCLSFIKMFVQNSIMTALHLFTVQLLKPRHLEEDYLIKTFFENKRFWSFFANGPIKFKVQLYTKVENFKSVWTYLTSQEMALKIHDFYGSVCKKPWESFVFKKCCDWIIFFQVPQFVVAM